MGIKQELEKKEKRTCLYDKHLSLGATMVSFGGFDMPLLYQNAGIAPEHFAVREHVGLFDVSHMGEASRVMMPSATCSTSSPTMWLEPP